MIGDSPAVVNGARGRVATDPPITGAIDAERQQTARGSLRNTGPSIAETLLMPIPRASRHPENDVI